MVGDVRGAVRWSATSQVGRQIVQLVTVLVLARLLQPDDFGLITMALVVVTFINLFKDLGTSAALIQSPVKTRELVSSVFWLSTLFGVFAAGLLFASAETIAALYSEPRLTEILQLLSLAFVISGLGSAHQALLEKEMRFSILAGIELLAAVIAASVAIGAASMGQGVHSLVYQGLAAPAVTTTLLWLRSRWIPDAVISMAALRSIGAYSGNLVGFNVFNFLARNADYVLIGRILGPQDLGYYTLAYRMMLFPLQNLSAVVGRVMFPFYAMIQSDDERLRTAYLRSTSVIALLTFPLMTGVLVLAEPLVLYVLGERWLPVVPVIQILAPVGAAQAIGATVGAIYQAKGRTDVLLRWGVFSGTLTVIAFVVGVNWGIVGVALGYFIATGLLSYHGLAIPLRLIGARVEHLLARLWRPAVCTVAMAAVLFPGREIFDADGGVTLALLIILVGLGAAAYGIASLFWNKQQLLDLLSLGRRIR